MQIQQSVHVCMCIDWRQGFASQRGKKDPSAGFHEYPPFSRFVCLVAINAVKRERERGNSFPASTVAVVEVVVANDICIGCLSLSWFLPRQDIPIGRFP